MMRRIIRFAVAVVPLLICLCGPLSCRRQTEPPAARKADIYVVSYPLKYFAERIGRDRAAVAFPAPPDADPAYWTPDPDAIRACQKADLILLNGANYAKWAINVPLPQSRVVNTSASFRDKYLIRDDVVFHKHGPEGEHEPEGTDFNTWLDPQQAIAQAHAIEEALAGLMPEDADEFEQHFETLRRDLQELDDALVAMSRSRAGKPLLASRPVYGYLARKCDWNLKSVYWEADAMPSDRAWAELASILAHHKAAWMLWHAPPCQQIVDKLEEMGVRCVVFRPCANVPEEGDYLEVMRRNIENLKPVFPKEPRPAAADDPQH